jgi:hypothetical protein
MRKVLFKKWIPYKYDEKRQKVEGTGKIDDKETSGLFHCWGIDIEEFNNGGCSFTIGIIELEDGSIDTAEPKNIKFIN